MTNTERDSLIKWHASHMQANFYAGRMEAARQHCAAFTALARVRAQALFNDGTGVHTRLADPVQQARRHPNNDRKAETRQEK